jgi:hypothetical protein
VKHEIFAIYAGVKVGPLGPLLPPRLSSCIYESWKLLKFLAEYIILLYTCTHVYILQFYTCIHMYMYTYVHVFMHSCVHACIHVYMYSYSSRVHNIIHQYLLPLQKRATSSECEQDSIPMELAQSISFVS